MIGKLVVLILSGVIGSTLISRLVSLETLFIFDLMFSLVLLFLCSPRFFVFCSPTPPPGVWACCGT
jgi:hypothetical protein